MNLIFNGYRKCINVLESCETFEHLDCASNFIRNYVDMMFLFKKMHLISNYQFKHYCIPYFNMLSDVIQTRAQEFQNAQEQNAEIDKQAQVAFAQLCTAHDYSHSFETIKVKGFYHEENNNIDAD